MSKVIFKMTFKHPNLKDTVSKNISHVGYIATRAGVDKTITEADLKKELDKGVEDLASSDETYLKYIDERPKSHGLFGQDGIEDPDAVQEEISHVNSYVWRAIVSLKEEDAKELGYLNKEAWQDMLRKKIPDMANEMGVKLTNLRWVAAVHMEKGHPHSHIMFWEKTPERTLGVCNSKVLDNIRKLYTDEIFEQERFQLLNEKNMMRDLLKDLAEGDVSKASQLLREVRESGLELKAFIDGMNQEGVVPRLYNDDEKVFAEKLQHLTEILPGKGRIALKFMPENVKEEVREIADYLLHQPELMSSLEKNLNAVEELTRLYTSDEKAIKSRQYQYSSIVNNIANNMYNYGIDKPQIFSMLKEWTDKQGESINLSTEVKYSVLKSLNFDGENKYKVPEDEEDFNNISMKIIEESTYTDINKIRGNYIQEQIGKRNELFSECVQKDLLRFEDNIYTITDKATVLLEEKESLNDIQNTILKNLSDKELSIDELLEYKHLKFKLESSNKDNEFQLKKYDATIIKDYFGKNNLLNINEFKEQLSNKFKSNVKQDEEYKLVTSRINRLVENGIVEKSGDNYSFTESGLERLKTVATGFEYTSYDANVLSNYIDKANGNLTEEKLREFLSVEYQSKEEIDKQFNYLLKRLNNNVNSGYAEKNVINGIDTYSITEKGLETREEILNPGTYKLKNYLEELTKKGIIISNEGKYSINKDFNYIFKNDVIANVKNNVYDLSKMQEDNKEYIEKLINNITNSNTDYNSVKDILGYKDVVDPVSRARENAYKDIVDRISQVILRGAAESLKDNIFYVDPELSSKAVDFIKNMNNKINLIPEQTKVLSEIATALVRTGHDDIQALNKLTDFADKENLNFPQESIQEILKKVRESGADSPNINTISSKKKVEYYLSVLKIAGFHEKEAFSIIKDTIRKDSIELENRLRQLKEDGILKVSKDTYKLTNKGIEEFLKIKDLDKVEKEILKMLEKDGEIIPKATFKDLIDNKEIFSNLHDKDPEEFKIGKFDLKVQEEFGEKNSLTLKELEKNIYDKYTDEQLNVNNEKAEQEFDILKNRIDKLTLNGYVEFDKESGVYKFTDEALAELENLDDKMEFTRYDANVTLKYIDKSENKILTAEELKVTLDKEIVNKTAKVYLEKFTELLESNQDKVKQFINVDEAGNIASTENGKFLGIELNKLNKYFYQAKGQLTEESLKGALIKEFGPQLAEEKFKGIMGNINKLIERGHITHDVKTGIFKIDPTTNDINRLLYQVYKEGGTINKADLKDVLEKNIKNKEAEAQFKYLTKRLDFLKKEGYLEGREEEYSITSAGAEKREDLLVPQRDLLRDKLEYLQRLGFISDSGEGYQITDKYYKYMQDIALAKEQGVERVSELLSKDIAAIIDRTQDKVNVGKIERTNERIATGIYVNGEYEEVKTDYSSMRSYCNVPDTTAKTVHHLATTLMVSGVDFETTRQIIQEWNNKSESHIDQEKLDEIVEDAYEAVEENNLWGNTTVISTKDWKATFESLGVDEKDIPKWIYKGENWESFNKGMGISHLISDLWKSVWRELEKQRMQTEAQAEMMKKQLNKQQATSQNIEATKEQVKKNRDRSSLYRDDELER